MHLKSLLWSALDTSFWISVFHQHFRTVQRKSLPEFEINFQMKSYANRTREICLKSVKIKSFDFCKALCLAFLVAMNISIEAICDWKMPINVKSLCLSQSSSNLCFDCAFDSCGSCRYSKHFVSFKSHFNSEYRPSHISKGAPERHQHYSDQSNGVGTIYFPSSSHKIPMKDREILKHLGLRSVEMKTNLFVELHKVSWSRCLVTCYVWNDLYQSCLRFLSSGKFCLVSRAPE